MKTPIPEPGSKVKFKGVDLFWYVEASKAAGKLLKPGEEYTVAYICSNLSWTGVVLKEFPAHKFCLTWFEIPETMEQNDKFKVKVIREQVSKNQAASDKLYNELAESLGVDADDQEAHDYLHDAIFNSSNEEDFNYAMNWFDIKIKEARQCKLEKQLKESSLRVWQALSHINKPYTRLEIFDMWLSGKFNAELLLHHALLELAK
jgi:hypothetical protein